MGRCRKPISASRRPYSQPRQHCQRLLGTRKLNPRKCHPGTRRIAEAYNAAQGIENPQENIQQYQEAQSKVKGALDIYVNAVREAYPELKANENFMALQTQLEGTENRITTERKRYTEAVQDYNTSIKKFPTNIYAGWFGFKEKQQFRAEAGAEKAPRVEF